MGIFINPKQKEWNRADISMDQVMESIHIFIVSTVFKQFCELKSCVDERDKHRKCVFIKISVDVLEYTQGLYSFQFSHECRQSSGSQTVVRGLLVVFRRCPMFC